MRPPSDEDIENYDEIMWSFIDMLQALLDWRKIVDLQYNGETVFRVTMSFPELLGPSHERDIQVVRSWDELPPLPEKHPPGYWRSVWEASQAEQQQPEAAAPRPAEPRYCPVPPPNPAKRRLSPLPEDLLRLKPQPLPYVPTIEDLRRTADAVSETMAAIGDGTAAPWLGFKAMAASLDALQQMFGRASAKPAAPVPAAATDSVCPANEPPPAQPTFAPAPSLLETLGNLAKGVVTAKISPGDALSVAEAALYDAAFPNETAAFRSRVANGLASVGEEAEGFAAELYNDAVDQVQTGVALAPYLIGPAGSLLSESGLPALIDRAKIDIDPHLAQGADLADKTSAAVQVALAAGSFGGTFADGWAAKRLVLPNPEPPPNRGLTFVLENSGKAKTPAGQAAQDFEAATEGAYSDVATRQRMVPALRYTNRNPKGAPHVKFDGHRQLDDGRIELIDGKRRIVRYSNKDGPVVKKKMKDALKRQSEALKQNPGYVGVLELPTKEAAKEARHVLERLGIRNIAVRVRQP
jgi:hypothetical protein